MKLFSLPQVHCNNMPSRGVSVFRQVTCFFRSGPDWEADPVTFKPAAEDLRKGAHFVTVLLGDRTASSVKCRFHFRDQWLLFSEVAFQSGKNHQVARNLRQSATMWTGLIVGFISIVCQALQFTTPHCRLTNTDLLLTHQVSTLKCNY